MSTRLLALIFFVICCFPVHADIPLPKPTIMKLSMKIKGLTLSGAEYNWGPNKRMWYDYVYPSTAR